MFGVIPVLVFLSTDTALNHSHQFELILIQGLTDALVTELENYWGAERGAIDTMLQTEVRFSTFFGSNTPTHTDFLFVQFDRKLSSMPPGEIFTSDSLMILILSVTARSPS